MKTAKLLLDHKADVNVLDNSKSTPLHYAASMGNLEIIVLLLDYGADVNAIDSDNQVPMELAAENHQSLSYKAILIIFMRHYQKLNLALPRAIQLKFDLPMNGGNNNNSTLNTPATDAVTPSPTPQGNTQTASREEKTTQLDESNGNSNHHNAMNNDDHDMMATSSSSHKTLYDQVQTGQVGKHSSKKMNQGGVPFNPYMNDEPIEYGSSSRMNNYHALRNDMIQQQPHSMKGGNMMSGKQLQQQQQHSASMNSLLSSIQSVKRVDSNGSAGYMMKPSSTAVTQGANASPMRSGTAPGGAGGRGGEGENEYPPQKRFSIAMLSDPRVDKKLLSPLYGPRKVSFIALPNTGAGGRKSDVVLSSSTSTSPTQFAFDRDRSNSTSPTKGLPTNTAHTNSGASLLSPINEEHKFSHTHHHTKGGGSSGIDAQGSIHDLDSARTEESPAQSIISQHDNKGLIGIAPSRSASILVTAAAAGGETMEDPSVKTRGSMSSTAGIHPSMKKAIQFASHMMRVPKKLKDSPKHATSSDLYYQQQQMMIERTQSKEEKHEEFVRDKLALLFPPAEYIPFLPNPHPGLDHFFPTNFDIIVAIEHCTDCHLHGNSFVSHTTTNHPYHQSTKGGGHGNNNNNNNNNGNNPNANQHDPMKYIMVANQVLTQIITTMLHYRLAVRLYAMRCKPLSGKRIGGLEVTMAIYHANESSSHADLEEQGSMSMDEEGGKRMEPENKHTIENWITHTVFSKLDTKRYGKRYKFLFCDFFYNFVVAFSSSAFDSWPNVKEVEQRAIHFVQSVFQECLPPEENRQGLHPSLQLNELSAERLKGKTSKYFVVV